jgi:hypothetical protein
MFLFLFQRRKKRTRNRELDLLDKDSIEWPIPPRREFHAWRVGFLIFHKANSDDVLLFVLEEEANSLEATRVSGPAARAGHAPWEAFRFVPIRHTPRKL